MKLDSLCKLWCEATPDQAIKLAPFAGGAVVALIALYCIPKIIQEGIRWYHIHKHQSITCINGKELFEAAKWGNAVAVKNGLVYSNRKYFGSKPINVAYVDPNSGDTAPMVALRNGYWKIYQDLKNSGKFNLSYTNPKTNEDAFDLLAKKKRFC